MWVNEKNTKVCTNFVTSNSNMYATLFSWTEVEHFFDIFFIKLDSPLIKTLDMIRFSSNQNIGEGESNFYEKNVKEVFNLCSTEQSCIHIGITRYKIGTLIEDM